ncbi:MAG: hypothetical protein H6558_08910 [Lewinellaceae bacterium]|nr:hypothetical protein [Lewinellaceae bacterium]MCB9289990.1 hypothetical protein [Lewinellaceae bacterium]
MKKLIFLFSLLTAGLWSCQNTGSSQKAPVADKEPAQPATVAFKKSQPKLGDYWYQGEAEISRYELAQNRYAGIHPGEAVLVFVTEDFLTDKEVKNENYSNPNSTPVLKMNMIRKFPTGLYSYVIMTSVFTPTKVKDFPQTLKVATTTQEWCGHTYQQVNFRNGKYKNTLHSYFENEADQITEVDYAILEDELYNRIRMNPEGLPTGKLKVLPSTVITRLLHLPFEPVEAEASLSDYSGPDFSGEGLRVYTLRYPALSRTLEIVFHSKAPFIIEGWTDAYPSIMDKKVRKSVARRTHTIKSAYWKKNGREDYALREKLGLEGI